ncbi:ABC transporter permease [Paenibacillus sp. VCA1]|uniref:ABC transporter permease n=1 Tax=Paenibacillus sp. VCA1 TaxID=3039148 RepID=UPI002871EA0E|nr:ABC transporter permease [Paenibacillus sp. VCA1]MDR9853303.1 ABC transporter permease [Paenibacillus sp. VCA1]
MDYFKNLISARHILVSLTRQDLKNRYRNSILGVAWNFLSPLGIVLIIGIVYSVVFKTSMEELIPYLFSGLLPWLFFTASAEGGSLSFLSSQGYIKQTQVPIEIFPLRASLVNFVNLLISIIAFFLIYIFINPNNFGLNMLLVIPALIIWLLFCSAWATISAIVNLYIRDFQPLQSLIIQGLFYLSPIIYKPEMLDSENFQWLYLLNPFYYMLEIIRRPLLGKELPSLQSWGISVILTLILCQIAILLINKIGRKITFRL